MDSTFFVGARVRRRPHVQMAARASGAGLTVVRLVRWDWLNHLQPGIVEGGKAFL